MKAYINSFESFGTKDGPGIRFVLFLQGCPLRCRYCHNVDTWNLQHPNYIYTAEEILQEVNRVRAFLTGGVTVSGGEPLLQADFVKEFFQLCHKNGIHTALDTSGYIFTEKSKEVLEETDLVLLDIKHIDPEKYYDLTSVELFPSLQFLEYLHKIQKDTWVRYVLVPGYTDDIEDLKKWAAYVSQYSNIKRVDILPFHQMAIYKWEKERRDYSLKDVLPPTKEKIILAEELFRSYGLPVYSE
ncbi:pyruvate formate-lyase-activating protein [Fusobacterium necrophorum]|uniref:pyruvate formate-lyase-activating protein n=1 Tax=Fusobacterium necrophorum TaxID=859 RepID=UPI00370EEB01